MSVVTLEREAPPSAGPGLIGRLLDFTSAAMQVWVGLTTYLYAAWLLDRVIRPHIGREPDERRSPGERLIWSFVLLAASTFVNLVLFSLFLGLRVVGMLAAGVEVTADAFQQNPVGLLVSSVPDLALFVFALVRMRRLPVYDPDFALYRRIVVFRLNLWRTVLQLLGTAIVLGLSLLPLSALLLAFPAINPQESVLTDAVSDRPSWLRRTLSRLFAVFAGLVVLVTILATAVEIVSRLPLPDHGSFAVIAQTFMPAPSDFMGQNEKERTAAISKLPSPMQSFVKTPLHEQLPPAMVQHWPFVILTVYALDLLILLTIGRVPLAYNLRNVRVRWKTNLMTVLAFTSVIGLLTFLLAFVNGMNNLTENTGVPGNVFVLSDGATDELFSNLVPAEVDNVERVTTDLDEKDRPLPAPVGVRVMDRGGKPVYMASRETYYSINQPVPNTDPPRRRFVQLRSHDDADIAAAVHNIELYPGGRWFGSSGVDDQSRIQCVLGEGVAGVLAADAGKARLVPGDTFELGDMTWVVTGVMKSEGTTFGSEIWVKRFSRIYGPFGKEKYTTLVMRTNQDTKAAARALAHHLTKRYTQQKLKVYAEPDYYAELTKANNFFLTAVVIVAVVMAIGGVFGMMTTMFASIAQRIRDIGVLRLLGFKRWQVTVSFLLESLTIAAIGGAVGCLVAWLLADGRTTTSTLSGGGGGPGGKSFALTIDVDTQVMALGMLFTLAMGRLGGLVPALSAMRMNVLDTLR